MREAKGCVLRKTLPAAHTRYLSVFAPPTKPISSHKALARLAIDDEFVIGLAVVKALPTLAVRQLSQARLTPPVDPAEDAEVREQNLNVLEQAFVLDASLTEQLWLLLETLTVPSVWNKPRR